MRGSLGQKISFAAHLAIRGKTAVRYVDVPEGTTIRKFCARRGHPELAHLVADLNGLRSIDTPIRVPHPLVRGPLSIAIPQAMAGKRELHILADDPPPIITAGYAKFDTVQRPQRRGLIRFTGSDPIAYDIPIQWEHFRDGDGKTVEKEIELLERFAGMDNPDELPPRMEISVTDNNGYAIPLMPLRHQARRSGGPLWWITNIQMDPNPQRTLRARRVRQRAVVSVAEYTSTQLITRSATKRWAETHTAGSAKSAARRGLNENPTNNGRLTV